MRGLKLFRATKKAAPAGPPPGQVPNAAEISDPSPFGWEVLWEALKTEPPADEPSTLTQELGLDQEREITSPYGGPSWYATEFSGTRHGRNVALRMGVIPKIRGNGYNEVHIASSVVPFRLGVADGRPAVQEGTAAALEQVVGNLAPAPDVWRKLEVDGGPDGILARRPVTAHPQGYLYDLWLIERIADQFGA